MTPMKSATNLVFVDLETSGLDPKQDVILEIAALPVDQNLEILHEGWSAVVQPLLPGKTWSSYENTDPHWALAQHQKAMNETVLEMHTENGLFKDLEEGKGIGLQAAMREFLRYSEQFVPHGQTPLAGSSVHFDRKFLERYMSPVDKFFHYRIADVSSVKEFWRRWYPEAGEPPKVKAHRALADCYASVAEARWYKDRLKVDPGVGMYRSPGVTGDLTDPV